MASYGTGEVAPPTDFGPLVHECKRRGICKTVAFRLAREGKLKTFLISNRRYVRIESFETLADQMSQASNDG